MEGVMEGSWSMIHVLLVRVFKINFLVHVLAVKGKLNANEDLQGMKEAIPSICSQGTYSSSPSFSSVSWGGGEKEEEVGENKQGAS